VTLFENKNFSRISVKTSNFSKKFQKYAFFLRHSSNLRHFPQKFHDLHSAKYTKKAISFLSKFRNFFSLPNAQKNPKNFHPAKYTKRSPYFPPYFYNQFAPFFRYFKGVYWCSIFSQLNFEIRVVWSEKLMFCFF
jgi:hypothetical protein